MENNVKGSIDVRNSGQANQHHRNGCEYNRKRDKISKDRKEKIDIKKATALSPDAWLLI